MVGKLPAEGILSDIFSVSFHNDNPREVYFKALQVFTKIKVCLKALKLSVHGLSKDTVLSC